MRISKKKVGFISMSLFMSLGLLVGYQNFNNSNSNISSDQSFEAPLCDQIKIDEILTAPSKENESVYVNCSIELHPSDVVKKKIVFQGAESSHSSFDCNGATIDVRHSEAVSIESRLVEEKANGMTLWSAPKNIQLKNCNILGSIRIRGMATNGEGKYLRASSRIDQFHTLRAQAAAPKRILLDNLKIVSSSIPIYVGPGATRVTISNSHFKDSEMLSTAIYLDAESAFNRITNNIFDVLPTVREIIAVDGSAKNTIAGNRFNNTNFGGVFIYRNCGEGGTIRHQKPEGNIIKNNHFYQQRGEGIHVSSRRGDRVYCSFDKGFPFGSSLNDGDFAENTIIENNKFFMNHENENHFNRFAIVSREPSTTLVDNSIFVVSKNLRTFEKRVAGRYTDGGGNTITNVSPKKK